MSGFRGGFKKPTYTEAEHSSVPYAPQRLFGNVIALANNKRSYVIFGNAGGSESWSRHARTGATDRNSEMTVGSEHWRLYRL